MRSFTASALVTSAVIAACTANPSSPGGSAPDASVPNDDASAVAAPGQLALKVHQARQSRDGSKVGALELSVTLANGQGGAAVPLASAYFRLKLKSGLIKMPVGGQVRWVDGTVPNTSDALADDASYGPWPLRFDVDAAADAPLELSFEMPGIAAAGTTIGDGRKATAAVSLEACTRCGSVCTYTDRDTANCGQCGRSTVVTGQSNACKNGNVVCDNADRPSACPIGTAIYCVNLQTDPSNCGACGNGVGIGSCVGGAPQCSANATLCDSVCTEDNSVYNCGSCSVQCKRASGDQCFHESGAATCGTQVACSTLLNGSPNYDDGCKRLNYKGCVRSDNNRCLSSGSANVCYCAY